MSSNETALPYRLRAISAGGGSMPNSKIKDLCSDAAIEIERLRAAFRSTLMRLAPELSHKEIDRTINGHTP